MPKVAFRVDASLQIGSGHVMRCLTLAEALRLRGADCHFICRMHPGHLAEMIADRQFPLHALPAGVPGFAPSASEAALLPAHASWLGRSWNEDAEETLAILDSLRPDWLVVDHYALDARWHESLCAQYRHLLVIDDLADRPHLCDVLMDQTFARDPAVYRPLVPPACRILCGSRYALLRPQFPALRADSLRRRQSSRLKRLLITMGGVDKDNVTGKVLGCLMRSALPPDCEIAVVMGITAPWLDDVRKAALGLPWPTRVLVNVQNMAAVMSSADLCIGAAGSTAWERCTLGLPTIMVTTADNQRDIARALQEHDAALCIGRHESSRFCSRLLDGISRLVDEPGLLARMSRAAASVTQGQGVDLVADTIMERV